MEVLVLFSYVILAVIAISFCERRYGKISGQEFCVLALVFPFVIGIFALMELRDFIINYKK